MTSIERALATAFAAVVLLPGCAAWENWNDETKVARRDFERADFQGALDSLAGGVENELDGLCYSLERGTIAQASGQYELSIGEFERAERKVEYFEDRGLSPKNAAQYAGSILVNEKTVPYEGEDFEKILIPVFQTRNYLLEGKDEDAMVEVRKTWFQQEQARRLHEKALGAADAEARAKGVDKSELPGIAGQVSYPPGALQSPESVYEITYAHYLSALISERLGNYQDAFISIKAAAKIRPDVGSVRIDLARLARLAEQDPPEGAAVSQLPPKNAGSVALLFDCGWAPHKREFKVVFPTYHSLGAIAIPIYERTENPAARARLVLGNRTFETAIFSDVNAIAFKNYRDKLPLLILKQAIRCAVKVAAGEATAYGVKEGLKSGKGKGREGAALAELAGWGAGELVGVYNAVSEQADLRAWLTLPESFQGARAFLPAGEYPARVELLGKGGGVLATADLGVVRVKPGRLAFVYARSVGSSLFVAAEHDGRGRPGG
jgi:hypothetical protein